MGKPAARKGDMHVCPMVSPGGVPHTGGKIVSGCTTVLINGEPAATAGDSCTCTGATDSIITGSSSVFIKDKPAARIYDKCAHGGVITTGSASVFIGGRNVEVNKELTKQGKNRAIRQAIKDAAFLLEKKLKLLEERDPKTLEDFMKWFGKGDEEAVQMILERIKKALVVVKELTVENFEKRTEDLTHQKIYARVYQRDKSYSIYITDLFWESDQSGRNIKAETVIHELSHFEDIGNTEDHVYGNGCINLAKWFPNDALNNADSFTIFIVG